MNIHKDMSPQNNGQLNWGRFNSVFCIEVSRGAEVFTSTAVAIDARTVITAAHSIDGADEVKICLGFDYQQTTEKIVANYWIINPNYNPKNSFYENDIAVIYLDDSLPAFTNFEDIPHHINLNSKSIIERVGFGGRAGKNIKTWTNPNYLSTTFNSKNFILQDRQSVIGDSGGPVFLVKDNKHILIGLHSTLEGVDKTYIVNLTYYHDWIYNLERLEVLP